MQNSIRIYGFYLIWFAVIFNYSGKSDCAPRAYLNGNSKLKPTNGFLWYEHDFNSRLADLDTNWANELTKISHGSPVNEWTGFKDVELVVDDDGGLIGYYNKNVDDIRGTASPKWGEEAFLRINGRGCEEQEDICKCRKPIVLVVDSTQQNNVPSLGNIEIDEVVNRNIKKHLSTDGMRKGDHGTADEVFQKKINYIYNLLSEPGQKGLRNHLLGSNLDKYLIMLLKNDLENNGRKLSERVEASEDITDVRQDFKSDIEIENYIRKNVDSIIQDIRGFRMNSKTVTENDGGSKPSHDGGCNGEGHINYLPCTWGDKESSDYVQTEDANDPSAELLNQDPSKDTVKSINVEIDTATPCNDDVYRVYFPPINEGPVGSIEAQSPFETTTTPIQSTMLQPVTSTKTDVPPTADITTTMSKAIDTNLIEITSSQDNLNGNSCLEDILSKKIDFIYNFLLASAKHDFNKEHVKVSELVGKSLPSPSKDENKENDGNETVFNIITTTLNPESSTVGIVEETTNPRTQSIAFTTGLTTLPSVGSTTTPISLDDYKATTTEIHSTIITTPIRIPISTEISTLVQPSTIGDIENSTLITTTTNSNSDSQHATADSPVLNSAHAGAGVSYSTENAADDGRILIIISGKSGGNMTTTNINQQLVNVGEAGYAPTNTELRSLVQNSLIGANSHTEEENKDQLLMMSDLLKANNLEVRPTRDVTTDGSLPQSTFNQQPEELISPDSNPMVTSDIWQEQLSTTPSTTTSRTTIMPSQVPGKDMYKLLKVFSKTILQDLPQGYDDDKLLLSVMQKYQKLAENSVQQDDDPLNQPDDAINTHNDRS